MCSKTGRIVYGTYKKPISFMIVALLLAFYMMFVYIYIYTSHWTFYQPAPYQWPKINTDIYGCHQLKIHTFFYEMIQQTMCFSIKAIWIVDNTSANNFGVHYSDVTMGAMAFWITGASILCSTVCVPGEFPAQRPVARNFDVFFDLRLNKLLSK